MTFVSQENSLEKYFIHDWNIDIPDDIKGIFYELFETDKLMFIGKHPKYGWFAAKTEYGPIVWSERDTSARANIHSRYSILKEQIPEKSKSRKIKW